MSDIFWVFTILRGDTIIIKSLFKYSNILLDWTELWYFNYNNVKIYFIKYNKYPQTRSNDKYEKDLGHWLSNQNNNYKKNIKAMQYDEYRIKYKDLVYEYKNLFSQFYNYLESTII